MTNPLRALRRWLRRIRYYSASRNQSRFGRHFDVIFFVSFLVSLPLAHAISHTIFSRPHPRSVMLHLATTPAGDIEARSYEDRLGADAASITGEVDISTSFRNFGWPIKTGEAWTPTKVRVMKYATG